MLEVTNLSDPKHVVFLALRWCHTLEHSSGVFVHCTKRIYCTWQLTIWNGKYSLNLLLEHAEFKFQTLAITLFIQTEMHIHMHAHMRIMSKSMLVVQRTFFAQMWFSLQKINYQSINQSVKTCPSSISQNWKYLKAAWRGSILWSVKLLSSGFDWTLCFWGLRHIIRHELC